MKRAADWPPVQFSFQGILRRRLQLEVAAGDIDARRFDRAIRLLRGRRDKDASTRLEIVLAAWNVVQYIRVMTDDDLLLAVLVFHGQHLAIDARDGRVDS